LKESVKRRALVRILIQKICIRGRDLHQPSGAAQSSELGNKPNVVDVAQKERRNAHEKTRSWRCYCSGDDWSDGTLSGCGHSGDDGRGCTEEEAAQGGHGQAARSRRENMGVDGACRELGHGAPSTLYPRLQVSTATFHLNQACLYHRRYFFTSAGSSLQIFSTATGRLISTIPAHSDTITALLLNPHDSAQLFSASLDGTLKRWDTHHGALLETLRIDQPVTHIAAHLSLPDELFVVTASLGPSYVSHLSIFCNSCQAMQGKIPTPVMYSESPPNPNINSLPPHLPFLTPQKRTNQVARPTLEKLVERLDSPFQRAVNF
jgi:hypothetical protein